MKWQVWERRRGAEMGRWRGEGFKTCINTYFNRQQQSSSLLQSLKTQSPQNETKNQPLSAHLLYHLKLTGPPQDIQGKKKNQLKLENIIFPVLASNAREMDCRKKEFWKAL